MLYKNLNKYIFIFLSIFLIFIIFSFKIDERGKNIVDESFNQAIIVFGVAKGLNGAISLAQGTQIQPPGLSISVGEVLDPINDLVEQFSWIMLASITSLGIQKILLNFIDSTWFNVVVIVLVLFFNFLLFFNFRRYLTIKLILSKILIIALFLRFAIPLMTITNNIIYNEYVKNDYNIEKRTDDLKLSSEEINSIAIKQIENKKQIEENKSLYEKSKNLISEITNDVKNIFSSEYYKEKIEKYTSIANQSSNFITDLIIAFVFKTLFFPLLFLIILYQILINIFRLSK